MGRRLRTSRRGASDWAFLPPELLEIILEKVTDICDYARFRCVCACWRSIANIKLQPQLPWLVIPSPIDDGSNSITFFNFLRRRRHVYGVLGLHEARWKWIYGSCHGWLVMIRGPNSRMVLLNPVSKEKIILPKLRLDWKALNKVVLCYHPAKVQPDKIFVALLTSEKLALLRNDAWSVVELPSPIIVDMIYYRQWLIFVTGNGEFAVLLPDSWEVRMVRPSLQVQSPYLVRLVEASENLLVLIWSSEGLDGRKLDLYKFEQDNGELICVKIGIMSIHTSNYQIGFVCAQGLPDSTGYRIYVSCEVEEGQGVTSTIDEIVVLHDIGIVAPHERGRSKWKIPAKVTWMVPSLH